MRIITYILSFSLLATIGFSQNAGTALDFDGSNDYVDCDTSSSFRPAQLTIEAWIYADTWRSNNWQGTILSTDSWSGTGGQRGWDLRTGDNGRLTLLAANGSTGAWVECMSAQLMSTGKWYHVAGTYDGSNQKVYINGVLVKTIANTGGIRYSTMEKMIIGDCTGQLGNRVFDGKIDEVRLWNVALDTTTMRKWMNKPISSAHPSSSNLVSYYKMNAGTGTTAYDSSGNSFDATLTNFAASPWQSSYVPMASTPSNFLHDLNAVWPVWSTASSSVFEVSDNMSGNTYVVFGHNGNSLSYNITNKPSYIQKRLGRIWRLEKEGSLSGSIKLDYANLDTNGFYTFKLLVSSDTNFSNASVISGNKIGNHQIVYNNISFQDSFYYCFGAYDYQGPTVETNLIEEVKAYSAKIRGKVLDDGGLQTNRGICWSTNVNPDIADSKTANGTGNGLYTANLSNLTANTTYHVRAYAYNTKDTVYGSDSTFTTPTPYAPTVTTDGTLSLFTDSALVAGTVVSDGDVNVTERGICWSSSANPKANLSTKVIKGSGEGYFTAMISGLTPNSQYHYRAYAINAVDTSYGADSSFTTLPISVPDVFTGGLSAITGYTATVSGGCTFDGRRAVSQKGIVWGTSANPTIALTTKTTEGGGIGNFASSLTNLQANTTYYARAYATNSVGTAYGADSVILTATHPEVQIDQISAITYYTATVKINVTSDGRMPITSRGICLGLSSNPDLSASAVIKAGATGVVNCNLVNLFPNTIYHTRAFAINDVDTSYSADSIFTTVATVASVVTTKKVVNVLATSALCGGIVISDGGTPVTERGLCWSTSANPTIVTGVKLTLGSGTGTFNGTMINLAKGTLYHVRAYAINNIDTSYGGDSSFTTLGAPTVVTDAISNIGAGTAQCGGTVTNDGGAAVIRRGVCWSNVPNPTANLSTKTTDGYGLGHYNSALSGLSANTTYYVKAYAINSMDTAYGQEINFLTPSAPEVITSGIELISGYTAKVNGEVVSGTNVTERGVVWSKYPNPSTGLTTKNIEGSGLGTFGSLITGLLANTTYHVRAYAINTVGIAYGGDSTFTTADKPSITTASISNIMSSSADCGGNVTDDGRMPVLLRGICWSSNPNPTVALSTKTNDGAGLGTFASSITGLQANKIYYVRAYAINDVDTAYGNERSFEITPPTAVTGAPTNSTIDGVELSGIVNAKGVLTNVYFEYGLTTAYGRNSAGIPNNITTSVDENISTTLSALTSNREYHYRLVAKCDHGEAYGADSTFYTLNNAISENPNDDLKIWSENGKIHIISKTSEALTLTIYNAIGKELVKDFVKGEYSYTVQEPQAIYFVRIQSSNLLVNNKLFVQ